MSDKTNSAPVVDTRRWYGGDPELWWMLIPPFGVAAGWASLTVAMLGGGLGRGRCCGPVAGGPGSDLQDDALCGAPRR